MGVNDGTGQGDTGSDGGFDINQVLGTSPSDTAGTMGDGQDAAQGQEVQSTGAKFKFGGREWENQQAAEKEFGKVWGKYSDQNGILNKIKSALKNPEDIKQLSRDPLWAEILGKLGVQTATREIDERRERESAEAPQDFQSLRDEVAVERATMRLEREKWGFERRLGRDVSQDEENAILAIIESSPSLTYEQAYKLAFHDKLLKEAATKAQGNGRPGGPRPPPPPSFIPGRKLNLKKPVGEMNREEAREDLRDFIREELPKH